MPQSAQRTQTTRRKSSGGTTSRLSVVGENEALVLGPWSEVQEEGVLKRRRVEVIQHLRAMRGRQALDGLYLDEHVVDDQVGAEFADNTVVEPYGDPDLFADG